ncbi:unnamed protein product, partial [Vitis vinifera]
MIFVEKRSLIQVLLESVRKLWNEWELRVMVLLSVSLQIVRILFSKRRKYTNTPWIRILIWAAYLSADWVATVSLGTLSSSQEDSDDKIMDPNYTLMEFWAPFILLHLVSLGTLSNSQGDSEGKLLDPNYTLMAFWAPFLLLHLGGPDTITAYSLEDNELWLRHLLGLVVQVGYGERTCEYGSLKDKMDNQFKHLYADLILSLDDQKTSERFIKELSFEDAFKVVEMELSFMYDVLYTKATVVYSLLGILLRIASFLSTISTLAAFCFFIDRHEFSNIDINITYLLLFGAIFLEVYALIKLILSDWSIVWLSSKKNPLADSIYRAITFFRSVLTSDKRWSRHMAQNNLIDSCLEDKTKFNQVPRFFDMNKFLEKYWYMTWEKSRCEISKCLSEYMLYLLVMCPFMLPKGIGEFRFRDTCSEAKRFFQQRRESISNRNEEACRLLLEVDTEVEPIKVKGDKSKSVLFEACGLAKKLKSLEMEMGEKWKMVSEVWKRSVIQVIPESVRKLWNEWELRVMVLLSVSLQIVLILFSKRRKYTTTPWIRILIWSAYLSADWVATVSLGTLSSSQGDSDGKFLDPNYTLMAFWAPFLLLHLGGPDTITAYSLEDNELWLRHLLGLVVQVGVAFYVFLRSWAGTRLTFLSIPMFVAGIIKYGERTWVLMSASSNHLRESLLPSPDPGPDYVEIMRGDTAINQFRHLYADLILSFSDRKNSEPIIRHLSPEEAFQVVEMEISFMYDVLYTKATVKVDDMKEPIFSLVLQMTNHAKDLRSLLKHRGDYVITKWGLFLQIVLIIFSNRRKYTFRPWIRILIWSAYLSADWVATVSLGTLSNSQGDSEGKLLDPNYTLMAFWAPFLLLHLGGPDNITAYSLEDNELWLRHLLGSVVQVGCGERTHERQVDRTGREIDAFKVVEMELNFMYDVLYTKATVIYSLLGILLRSTSFSFTISTLAAFYFFIDKHEFSNIDIDITYLLLFGAIFLEVYAMTNDVRDLRSLLKHRGDYVITKRGFIETLGWSIVDVEFDHSILLWHIATDLCSYSDDDPNPKSICKISKCLSEYMLYLLVMCPFMLPKGIGEYRFRDTCSETKRFVQQRSESISNRNEACRLLLEVDTEVQPKEVKGDKSKSVLFEACRLAKELKSLNMEMGEKWMMVSHVWVEMLCHAASHCGWIQHGQQLGRGGELLTHVSLLMSHLGLTEQFQILEGENIPKTIPKPLFTVPPLSPSSPHAPSDSISSS